MKKVAQAKNKQKKFLFTLFLFLAFLLTLLGLKFYFIRQIKTTSGGKLYPISETKPNREDFFWRIYPKAKIRINKKFVSDKTPLVFKIGQKPKKCGNY